MFKEAYSTSHAMKRSLRQLFWPAALTVLTEQDRLKDVLVFSGFMELKFYVGYSSFTAKALFIGEY